MRFLFKDNLFIVIIKTNQMNNLIIKPNTINFQELVNGNTDKLTLNFKSKMIDKLETNFTEFQSRWFIANVYAFLMYHSTKDFPINIDTIYKLIGFANKANAKRALINNFIKDEDYKVLLIPRDEQKLNDNRGGSNEETIMLNIDTFKSLCMIVKTDKAKEIRKYYIKLENIFNEIVNDERLEYELEQKALLNKVKKLEDKNNNLIIQKQFEKHNMLLREFGNIGSIVYIIKVKSFDDGTYIVRIGESRRGIEDRYKEHKSNYTECIILECFMVNKSKDFEKFIHTQIKENKVTDLDGHTNENELFLIGKNVSYNTLLNVINTNLKYFNNNDLELSLAELEIKKLQEMNEILNNDNFNNIFNQVLEINKNIMNRLDKIELQNGEILEKLNVPKTTNNFKEPLNILGPRLQKINPESLLLIKVYESISECIKENQDIKRSSINKAVIENTIYNGFRWLLVDRELNPNVIYDIKETKVTRVQNLGYIAKLNIDKTEILNVYLDRKTASVLNNYPNNSSLDIIVKKMKLSNGNYYLLYDKCNVNLRKAFEDKYSNPILYKNGIGRFDGNNNLVDEFVSKYDCCQKLNISDKSVIKSINKNIAYNGFYYKVLPSKLKIT
jgi:phage anti-repressor protein